MRAGADTDADDGDEEDRVRRRGKERDGGGGGDDGAADDDADGADPVREGTGRELHDGVAPHERRERESEFGVGDAVDGL